MNVKKYLEIALLEYQRETQCEGGDTREYLDNDEWGLAFEELLYLGGVNGEFWKAMAYAAYHMTDLPEMNSDIPK